MNPLKSTYEYDDIARDYKSMMLPSKKELMDKKQPMVTDGVLVMQERRSWVMKLIFREKQSNH